MIQSKLEYKPAINALRRAAAQMGNTRPLMGAVAHIMSRAVEDNFEQEGRPKWQDLAPSTKLGLQVSGQGWKALRQGGSISVKPWSGKILQRSGGLASSMVERYTGTTAVVGTNKIYAAIHQFGGKTKAHVIKPKHKRALSFGGIVVRQVNHPGSNIPARPFLRLTPRDQRDIVEVGQDFYQSAIDRNKPIG